MGPQKIGAEARQKNLITQDIHNLCRTPVIPGRNLDSGLRG